MLQPPAEIIELLEIAILETQLAAAVLELLKQGKPFTKENLEQTYVAKRRDSWVDREGLVAEKARDGFHKGVVTGLIGMALAEGLAILMYFVVTR